MTLQGSNLVPRKLLRNFLFAAANGAQAQLGGKHGEFRFARIR